MSSANCALVIDQDLIPQRSAFFYSSQQTAYPAANALDLTRRARTWRSTGYWNIESGSNTFVIADSLIGSNLTVTVPVAEYTSDTAFFAAIKTAMEAVSDSTFTVSRDTSTNKIKLFATLGGAATAFQIRGAVAGNGLLPIMGYALSNTDGSTTHIADLLKLHTEEYLIFDFGAPVSPTCFLGFSDSGRAIRISSSATVTLLGNATNSLAGWASPQVTESVVVADQGIGLVNRYGMGGTSAAAGTACRYWKLKIVDADNAYGHIELGAVILGTHISLTRGNAVFPLNVRNSDLTKREYTESGQTVASKKGQTKRFELQWQGLTKSEMDDVSAVYDTFGLHSPFAVILDEDGAFSTDLMRWAKLVRMEVEPNDALVSPNNWESQWQLREEL